MDRPTLYDAIRAMFVDLVLSFYNYIKNRLHYGRPLKNYYIFNFKQFSGVLRCISISKKIVTGHLKPVTIFYL